MLDIMAISSVCVNQFWFVQHPEFLTPLDYAYVSTAAYGRDPAGKLLHA